MLKRKYTYIIRCVLCRIHRRRAIASPLINQCGRIANVTYDLTSTGRQCAPTDFYGSDFCPAGPSERLRLVALGTGPFERALQRHLRYISAVQRTIYPVLGHYISGSYILRCTSVDKIFIFV